MATTAEIRTKAAEKLGLLGTGQTLQSNITADLDDAYTEVYGMMESLGLANWGTSSTAIPDALVDPIVSWVSGLRATRYGVPAERYQRIMAEYLGIGMPSAEDRIRALIAPSKVRQTKIQNF